MAADRARVTTVDELEALAGRLARQIQEAGGWATPMYTDAAGVCLVIGVSPRTLQAWRAAGTFPAGLRAHRVLFDLLDVARWLESRRIHARESADGVRDPAGPDIPTGGSDGDNSPRGHGADDA